MTALPGDSPYQPPPPDEMTGPPNPTIPTDQNTGTTVEDLYPEGGTGTGGEGNVGDVVGADAVGPGISGAEVTETNKDVGNVTGESTQLTDEQRVDAELKRILGEDSPLLAQARAQAMQQARRAQASYKARVARYSMPSA